MHFGVERVSMSLRVDMKLSVGHGPFRSTSIIETIQGIERSKTL